MKTARLTIKLQSLCLLALLLTVSCGILEPEEEKKPKFEIVSVSKGMKSYDAPFLTLTAKNTGDATGYNVSCNALAIKGSTIIDDGFAYFAGGADIRPGMSAVDEAIFFELSSHNDYDRLEYELSWLKK